MNCKQLEEVKHPTKSSLYLSICKKNNKRRGKGESGEDDGYHHEHAVYRYYRQGINLIKDRRNLTY